MKTFLAAVAVVCAGFLSLASFSQNFTYVGSKKCEICHRTEKQGMQYQVWEKSFHARSAAAPASAAAAQMAQAMGFTGDPAKSEKCLKCHVPLYEKAPEIKNEGVTCEVCHGPGSEYRKLSIMQNREEALKNGLTHLQTPEEVRKSCMPCHDNPHGIAFDFNAAHEKIKHLVPRAK